VGIQKLALAPRETFTAHELDDIIYPEQKNLVVGIGTPSKFK